MSVLQLGNPIPKVWLHMDFDYEDTLKYIGDQVIESEEELKRLNEKYFPGVTQNLGACQDPERSIENGNGK